MLERAHQDVKQLLTAVLRLDAENDEQRATRAAELRDACRESMNEASVWFTRAYLDMVEKGELPECSTHSHHAFVWDNCCHQLMHLDGSAALLSLDDPEPMPPDVHAILDKELARAIELFEQKTGRPSA